MFWQDIYTMIQEPKHLECGTMTLEIKKKITTKNLKKKRKNTAW